MAALGVSEDPLPHTPREHYKRVGIVAPKKQRIVIGQPFFKRCETGPALACLHLGGGRRLLTPKNVNINVVPSAAKTASTRQGVSFGMNAQRFVSRYDLALYTTAFTTVTSGAHGTAASLARTGPRSDAFSSLPLIGNERIQATKSSCVTILARPAFRIVSSCLRTASKIRVRLIPATRAASGRG